MRDRHRRSRSVALATLLALLMGGATSSPVYGATALRPDLAAVAPFDFRIDTSVPGKRLLRFSTVVVNIGPGPFRLYGYDPSGVQKGETIKVRQMIRQSDGTWVTRETGAVMTYSGDGHDHWHVVGAQAFKLLDVKSNGLRAAAKIGFCFLDSYPWTSTRPDHFNSTLPVCNINRYGNVPMGVSKGWGDIYKYDIAFQYIDITGIPNGDYRVRMIVDPPSESGGRFVETNEANNRSWAIVRIGTSSVTVLSSSPRP